MPYSLRHPPSEHATPMPTGRVGLSAAQRHNFNWVRISQVPPWGHMSSTLGASWDESGQGAVAPIGVPQQPEPLPPLSPRPRPEKPEKRA